MGADGRWGGHRGALGNPASPGLYKRQGLTLILFSSSSRMPRDCNSLLLSSRSRTFSIRPRYSSLLSVLLRFDTLPSYPSFFDSATGSPFSYLATLPIYGYKPLSSHYFSTENQLPYTMDGRRSRQTSLSTTMSDAVDTTIPSSQRTEGGDYTRQLPHADQPHMAVSPLSVPAGVDPTASLLAAQALITNALGQRPVPVPEAMHQVGPVPHAAPQGIHDPPASWYEDIDLPRTAARYLWWGLSPNTRRTYGAAHRSYVTCCAINGRLTPFPPTLETLCIWAAELGNSGGTKVSTIKLYLTGLRSYCVDPGLEPLTAFEHPRLQRIVRGVRGQLWTQADWGWPAIPCHA